MYEKPIPELFNNIISMYRLLYNEYSLDTLLFITDGLFEAEGIIRNGQSFEPHKSDPHIYRYIFCNDALVGGRILHFGSNYQLIAEPANLVVKEMGDNFIGYLKKECAMSLGPDNIPKFNL